ncbi:MAG TPA: hypothetical protein VLF43_05500 [Candidatus Saccharimonadales bacterium]|nr:hypothetical protein [Candidatus Saccharimonadales bacterium]
MSVSTESRVLAIDSIPLIDEELLPAPAECTLTDTAIWGVAARAVEQYSADLVATKGVNPETVERTAALACKNMCAAMPVTRDLRARSVAAIADVEPLIDFWPSTDDGNVWQRSIRQMVVLTKECHALPIGPEQAAVDTEALGVIVDALQTQAQSSPDRFARAEAADVLVHGIDVLRGSVSLAA